MTHERGCGVGWAVAWACLLGTLPAGCSKEAAPGPGPGAERKEDRKPDKKADPLAEARERSKANLKQIAAAFWKYEETNRFYPIGLIDPKTGRLGLSWRVQILPHLQDATASELSKQFRLNEPWDSDHNKALLGKMPKVYAPVRGEAPAGHTFYQGFADHYLKENGKEFGPKEFFGPFSTGAFFPDPRASFREQGKDANGGLPVRGRRVASITDGTTNTFLVAEAGAAVPWSQPQDIPFRFKVGNSIKAGQWPWEAGAWPKLGGLFDGDFHAVMVDGTVHYIKKGAPVEKLRSFITFSDGIVPDYRGIGLEEPEWLKELRKQEPPQTGEPKGKLPRPPGR